MRDAIEVLTERVHIRDAERGMGDVNFRREFRPEPIWQIPLADSSPRRTLWLHKNYNVIHEAITGEQVDFSGYFLDENRQEALHAAIYGTRKIGWKRPDFPLKYSLPEDTTAILDALEEKTQDEINANVNVMIDRSGRDKEQLSFSSETLRNELAPRVLPALRRFYRAAREAEEVIVYWMG